MKSVTLLRSASRERKGPFLAACSDLTLLLTAGAVSHPARVEAVSESRRERVKLALLGRVVARHFAARLLPPPVRVGTHALTLLLKSVFS